jgi:hypothetical protein
MLSSAKQVQAMGPAFPTTTVIASTMDTPPFVSVFCISKTEARGIHDVVES